MANDFLSDDQMNALQAGGKAQDVPQGHAPGFISDDDMNHLESQGHAKNVAKPSDPGGAALAGLNSYGDTLTGGYAPQLQAAAAPAVDHALFWAWKHGLVPGLDPKNAPESYDQFKDNKTYVERRDDARKAIEQGKADHPTASAIGTGLGVVNQAFAAAPLMEAAAPFEGAGLAGKLGNAAATGAGLGALQNPGDTEGQVNPLQATDRLKNGAIGAAIGAGTQGLISGATNIGQKIINLPSSLKDTAEKMAFRALGPNARSAQTNYARGAINNIGRAALDNGVISAAPASYETIANRAAQAAEQSGQGIGSVIKGLSDEGATVDSSKVANSLQKDLVSPSKIPGTAEQNDYFAKLIKQVKANGEMPLADAQQLKTDLGQQINWQRLPGADIPPQEQFHRSLYSNLGKAISDAAGSAAESSSFPGASEFPQMKQAYGGLSEAAKIAGTKSSKLAGSNIVSTGDKVFGLGGAALGFTQGDTLDEKIKHGLEGAALGVGHHALNLYGPQIAATAADKVASVLASDPAQLGKWAQPLIQYAQKSPQMFQVAVQSLMNNPDFQKQTGIQPPQQQQPQDNSQLMKTLSQRPELIDKLQNPQLKGMLQKKLGRDPSADQAAPDQSKILPLEQVQQQFQKDYK